MDEATRLVRDMESFHRRYGLFPKGPTRWQRAKNWLRRLLQRRGDTPPDPYAYVTARPKPRPPYLRGRARRISRRRNPPAELSSVHRSGCPGTGATPIRPVESRPDPPQLRGEQADN